MTINKIEAAPQCGVCKASQRAFVINYDTGAATCSRCGQLWRLTVRYEHPPCDGPECFIDRMNIVTWWGCALVGRPGEYVGRYPQRQGLWTDGRTPMWFKRQSKLEGRGGT